MKKLITVTLFLSFFVSILSIPLFADNKDKKDDDKTDLNCARKSIHEIFGMFADLSNLELTYVSVVKSGLTKFSAKLTKRDDPSHPYAYTGYIKINYGESGICHFVGADELTCTVSKYLPFHVVNEQTKEAYSVLYDGCNKEWFYSIEKSLSKYESPFGGQVSSENRRLGPL